jgi:hypothetical protein
VLVFCGLEVADTGDAIAGNADTCEAQWCSGAVRDLGIDDDGGFVLRAR